MGKKELKRVLKLYKSDLNSMAEESIKYKELAERATVDCAVLTATLEKTRERTILAENMVARLIEKIYAGQHLKVKKLRANPLIAWYASLIDLADEWQNSKANNG